MKIRVIEKGDLETLGPLLRASYGMDDFSPQDELEAFDEARPKAWFVLTDPDPKGFIRYVPLAENLYVGELYAVPGPARAARLRRLLEHFLAHPACRGRRGCGWMFSSPIPTSIACCPKFRTQRPRPSPFIRLRLPYIPSHP